MQLIHRTLLVLPLATVLAGLPGRARAEVEWRFCNEGDEPAYIVALQDFEGPFGMLSPPSHQMSGYIKAEPNECASVFQDMNYSTIYPLLMRYDSKGNFGYEIYPIHRGDNLVREQAVDRVACFPLAGNYDHQIAAADIATCPVNAPGWVTLHFYQADTAIANGGLHYTFHIEPHQKDALDVVIEQAAEKAAGGVNCGPGLC